ncbi:MAG: phosphatidate cytidylyltransferase [Verrucomicrobiales bacterium]|jgi:phosphatidate cytidylyltransferase
MPEQNKTAAPAVKKSKGAVFVARLSSTLVLWALISGALWFNNSYLFYLLVSSLGLLGYWEFLQMLGHRSKSFNVLRNWSLLVAGGYLLVRFNHFERFGSSDFGAVESVAIFLAITGAFTVMLPFKIDARRTIEQITQAGFGFVYVVILFTFLAHLIYLPKDAGAGAPTGGFYLLFVLVVTKFTDMGAYVTGTLIGKHKMIPHISPGKTWQGFFGAIVWAVLGGFVVFWIFPSQLQLLTPMHVIILGVILALASVIGDLAESVLKRSLDVKDSGHVLPGIGGALDLIDSLLFTAPIFYFYLRAVQG